MPSPPLGVMFHHFTNDVHPSIQGAIDGPAFREILERIGVERFLTPEEWIDRSLTGTLRPRDLCLTFDDALRSQMDVALPVLEELGVKAFFFVYSSVFKGQLEIFELVRFFRNQCFPKVDDFYNAFYENARKLPSADLIEREKNSSAAFDHLNAYSFYTEADRRFRYIRDKVISTEQYHAMCHQMMAASGFLESPMIGRIWMTDTDLKRLAHLGHAIGLHSTTHPTNLGDRPYEKQLSEYAENRDHLAALLGQAPDTVAYPSGSYGPETLRIMRDFGVRIGFCSTLGPMKGELLEQPRLDYTIFEI